MPRLSPLALVLLGAFALGACAASPGNSTSPSASIAAPTEGASMAPVGSSDPAPGTGNTDWCLNTAEEVSAAIGGAAVTATGTDVQGVGGACNYTIADGTLIYSVAVVNNEAAVSSFQAMQGSEGIVQIPGIGDGAILASPQGPLAILKGNAFISLGLLPGSGVTDAAEMRTKLEQLGKAAADRL